MCWSSRPPSYFYPRLREEGDLRATAEVTHNTNEFLSTPSARRATKNPLSVVYLGCISIHALREEGD